MSVSILILTHASIGSSLIDAAKQTLGELPLQLMAMSITKDCCMEKSIHQIKLSIGEIDQGDGVLILTDLYGSTPSNLAQRFNNGTGARVISGVNLSMIIRVLNYPTLNLNQLCEKAYTGGKDGIVDCHQCCHGEI